MSVIQTQKRKPNTLETALHSAKADENVSKVITHLITTDSDLESKTELSLNQILTMGRGVWYAKRYGSRALASFDEDDNINGGLIAYILRFMVSKDRKGRSELVDALKGAFVYEAEKSKPRLEL